MADESLKKLLVKLGISTKDWKTAVKEIKADLEDQNKKAKKAQADHDAATKKSIALEKERQKEATASLQALDRQIKRLADKIVIEGQDLERVKELVAKEKQLLSVKDAQIKVMEQMPKFHDVDLSKMKEKLALQKAELGLEEAKAKVRMGQAAVVPSATATAAISSAPGRLAALENQLTSLKSKGEQANVQAEMRANTAQLNAGTMEVQKYVAEQTKLQTALHNLRMTQIKEEEAAKVKQVEADVKIGKMEVQEAEARTKVIRELATQRAAAEERANKQVMATIQKMGVPAAARTMSESQRIGLTAQLAGLQSRGRQSEIQAEMTENNELLAKKEIKEAAYIQKQKALQLELHNLRMAAIREEVAARVKQLELEVSADKKSVEEGKIRTKLLIEQANQRLAAEERANKMAMTSIGGAGKAGGEGGGGVLGVLGRIGMFMGGGLAPEIMLGVAAGQGLLEVLDKIAEKFKEILLENSQEQQLRDQFEKLTKRAGEDPEVAIEKLKKATRGLIDEENLYRVSNNFMQAGVKATTDQVGELTKYTLGLARAQGRSAPQAMQSLVQASLTGRTMMLAMATGIDRTRLQLVGLGGTIDPITRKNIEFTHTLDEMRKRYQEIGEPALTFQDRMIQLHVAVKNSIEDFAQSTARTRGFQEVLGLIGKAAELFANNASHISKVLGEYVGLAFQNVADTANLVLTIFRSLKTSAAELAGVLNSTLSPALKTLFGGKADAQNFTDFILRLVGLRTKFMTLSVVLNEVAGGYKRMALAIVASAKAAKEAAEGDFDAAHKTLQKLDFDVEEIAKKNSKKRKELWDWISKGEKPKSETSELPPAGPQQNDEAMQLAQKLADLRVQIARAEAKEKYELTKEYLKLEGEAVQQNYDQGLMSLEKYVAARKELLRADHAAQMAQLDADARYQKGKLQEETRAIYNKKGELVQPPKITPQEAALQSHLIDINTRTAKETAQIGFNAQMAALDKQLIDDRVNAQRKGVEEARKLNMTELQDRKQLIEEEFKLGAVSADQYIDMRRQMIAREYSLTVDALNDRKQLAKKNATEMVAIEAEYAQASIKYVQELTELYRNESKYRLEALQASYQSAQRYLQATGGVATATYGERGGLAATDGQLELAKIRIDKLMDEERVLRDLKDTSEEYFRQWLDVKTEIANANEEAIKLVQEQARLRDGLRPIADMMSTIGGMFGGVVQGKIRAGFDTASRTFSALSQYRVQSAGQIGLSGKPLTGNPYKDLIPQLRGLFTKRPEKMPDTRSEQEKLNASLRGATKLTTDFGGTLTSVSGKVSAGFEKTVGSFSSTVSSIASRLSQPISSTVEVINSFASSVQAATDRLDNLGTQQPQDQNTPFITGGSIPGGSEDISASPLSIPGLDQSNDPMKQFVDNISGANQALGSGKKGDSSSFTGRLQSAMGAIQGVAAGFAGVAQAWGSAKGSLSGAFSGGMAGMSAGAAFGPIGAAIGGIGGAIGGAIFGHKAAEMQRKVEQLNRAFNNVVTSLSMGTTKLGDAIKQLQAIRQTTVAQMSSSKKGRKQLPQILQGFDAEINQLLAQQKQMLDQMRKQINVLLSPTGLQEYLSQVGDIIKQYQDFASAAAGDTQAMAQANMFLVASLHQYAVTQRNELASAEQQAVQNAIQLNDLYMQRKQLMSEFQQQEYDIMSEGNISRQRTSAQTKQSKLTELKYQHDLQMQDLNAQIDVAQHKYDIEKQIFDLATTRVGLEAQLVQLENQQADFDIQRTQALQQVVNQLSQMESSGTLGDLQTLTALFQKFGLQMPVAFTGETQYQVLTPEQILQNAGHNPYDPSLGYGPNYGLPQPVGTPSTYPYYPQGAAVTPSSGSSLYPGGPVGGIMQTGSQIFRSMPGYETGGPVQQTGPAVVHAGEYVLTMDQVKLLMSQNPWQAAGVIAAMKKGMVTPKIHDVVSSVLGVDINTLKTGAGTQTPKTLLASTVAGQMQTQLAAQAVSASQTRASIETQIASIHQKTISSDLARIQAMHDLLDRMEKIRGSGGVTFDLEKAFTDMYAIRGRYGSGGFFREYL